MTRQCGPQHIKQITTYRNQSTIIHFENLLPITPRSSQRRIRGRMRERERRAIKCGCPAGDTPHIIKRRTQEQQTHYEIHQLLRGGPSHPAQYHILPTGSTTPQTRRTTCHSPKTQDHLTLLSGAYTWPHRVNHSRSLSTHTFFIDVSTSACCASFVFDPGTSFWRFSASFETSYALHKSHDTLAADHRRQLALSTLSPEASMAQGSCYDTYPQAFPDLRLLSSMCFASRTPVALGTGLFQIQLNLQSEICCFHSYIFLDTASFQQGGTFFLF